MTTKHIDLELLLNLVDITDVEVGLGIDISAGTMDIDGLDPGFSQLNGRVQIDDELISAEGLTANFLDYPVQIRVEPFFAQ